MFRHNWDIVCACTAMQQKWEYPYKEDVQSHFTAATHVLFTVSTVWFHYLVTTVLCYWDISESLETPGQWLPHTRLGGLLSHLAVCSGDCYERSLMKRILIPCQYELALEWDTCIFIYGLFSSACMMCSTNLPIRMCLRAIILYTWRRVHWCALELLPWDTCSSLDCNSLPMFRYSFS